ncbi:MAG TPA: chromate efflux transporter [Capillimicrobium sp.]
MRVPIFTVLREWGRIGLIGFGGPPAHVALLRQLCVDDRRWIDDREFEDANAACGLLPGPASTQLAIYCAHRVGGLAGGIAGGIAFIVPGLLMILVLAGTALAGGAPDWILAVGAGAGAAVVPVVAQAGIALCRSSLGGLHGLRLARAIAYLLVGAVAVLLAGWGVVLALVACGLVELALRRARGTRAHTAAAHAWPIVLAAASQLAPLSWTALKVGLLSYGGGFVIIPLMQGDAVDVHGWMSQAEFLNAVAFGQLTPGPVTHTVAVVGWAAGGLGGALLASLIAFVPSFVLVFLLAPRFHAIRASASARAFLDGAGPAAIGAILGAALLLLDGVDDAWQWVLLGVAAAALALGRRPIEVLLGGLVAGIALWAVGVA